MSNLTDRFAQDRANAAAAEAEARALEAEMARVRNFQAPDRLAERRRLEAENAARFAAEVAFEAERNAAARLEPRVEAPAEQLKRKNWIEWRK